MCEYLFCYFFTPSMQCLSFACSIVVYSRKAHDSSKKLAEHALHFARMHNLVPRALSLAREKRLGRRLQNAVSNPELNRLLGTVGSVMTIGLSIESPFTNNNNTEQQQFIQLSNNLSLCYPQLAELF